MPDTYLLTLKELNDLSRKIINAAMEVHTYHGPGMFESIYADSLLIELHERGFKVDTEVLIPIDYKGIPLNKYKKIDMIIENAIVLELKAVDVILPVHKKQLLTYLRISHRKLGLLINFNTEHLKDGITRVIN